MPKNKETKDKISFTGFDPVETPEEIIAADKNTQRREAFKEAYKIAMTIVPNYFLTLKKHKPNSGGTGGGFSQEIKITPESIKVETKGENVTKGKEEQKQKELGDD